MKYNKEIKRPLIEHDNKEQIEYGNNEKMTVYNE